jgi:uncharacterized membrane protein
MNIVLWIIQIVLAVLFLIAGVTKSTRPRPVLEKQLPWVADFSTPTVRLIGVVELLGAIGLILPALTGIATVLTPLAATGLAVVMLSAAATHARRREPAAIAFNTVLLVLAAVVAWGRFGPYAL